MLFRSCKVLFLCFEVEGETMRLIFLTKDFMAFGTKLLVENVKDVLHNFKSFLNFDLLMMKEVGD
jgi:hypothetical protein